MASVTTLARLYFVAAILLAFCSSSILFVESFQHVPNLSCLVRGWPQTTASIKVTQSTQLPSTAAADSGDSFASKWMENERKIEDQMDNNETSSTKESNNNLDESNLPFGKWEYINGNYILRPPNDTEQQPRALLHFLGGALLGAAPQLTYRYLLERLARRGYLIVATPYQLSFDHLKTCDEIIDKFERGEILSD
jgi:acetyl esterase/lipase